MLSVEYLFAFIVLSENSHRKQLVPGIKEGGVLPVELEGLISGQCTLTGIRLLILCNEQELGPQGCPKAAPRLMNGISILGS